MQAIQSSVIWGKIERRCLTGSGCVVAHSSVWCFVECFMVPKYPTTKCGNKTFAVFKLKAAVSSLKYFIKVPFSITSISWTVSLHLVYILHEDIKQPSYYLLDRSVCDLTIVSFSMAQLKKYKSICCRRKSV